MYLSLQADDLLHADLRPHKLVVNLRNADAMLIQIAKIKSILGDKDLPICQDVLQVIVELVKKLVAILTFPYDLQLPLSCVKINVLAETREVYFLEVHCEVFHLHVALPHHLLDPLVERFAQPVV